MISKNQLKLLRALGQKKQRKQLGQFLVQGEKNVAELLDSKLNIVHVFASTDFENKYQQQLENIAFTQADEDALSKASTLTSNNAAIAIVEQPKQNTPDQTGLRLVLDGVSDPGNLGTIIRLADWFGVKQVILSDDCADVFNPKTISATMGSFCRVDAVTTDIEQYLENQQHQPILGAFLGGNSVHQHSYQQDTIIVMGSESHGIRPNIERLVSDKITIPSFGHAESLNVAMATGIILDNVRRTFTQ